MVNSGKGARGHPVFSTQKMKSIYFDLHIPKFLLTRIGGYVLRSSISPASFGDVKEEPLPGPRWVRVKNLLSRICGTDLTLFFLEMSPKVSLAALPAHARVFLAHEISGEVVDVGKGTVGYVKINQKDPFPLISLVSKTPLQNPLKKETAPTLPIMQHPFH